MITLDLYQRVVARQLTQLKKQFERHARANLFHHFRSIFKPRSTSEIQGLYIWGGVGRGKTHLMDGFVDSVSTTRKLRMHFHEFMQMIHAELAPLKRVKNPISRVTENLAEAYDLVCLDEFFVSDIGDAMILYQLLEEMLSHNVILVTTSNIKPSELYKNGLQRQRFVPAIELIEKHFRIVELAGVIDYRLIALRNEELYRVVSTLTPALIRRDWQRVNGRTRLDAPILTINGRSLMTVFGGRGVVGFRFTTLCVEPRSAADYIEIARIHHTIFVYDVPQLTQADEESTTRFITMIDVFYDYAVNLLLRAHVPLTELYVGQLHRSVFTRTSSRITEMMSEGHLARAHES